MSITSKSIFLSFNSGLWSVLPKISFALVHNWQVSLVKKVRDALFITEVENSLWKIMVVYNAGVQEKW